MVQRLAYAFYVLEGGEEQTITTSIVILMRGGRFRR
jgi:hypothetical protein